MYITACVFGVNCVSGMLNIVRKSILEEAGGLVEFAKYISEDYYMGIAVLKRYVDTNFIFLKTVLI